MAEYRRADRRLRQRGAVAVEFAIVAPILIALVIGAITSGVSYSHALGLTNAVREGARFGAVADATLGSWEGNVVTRVRDTQFDDPSAPAHKTSIRVEFWNGTTLVKSHDDPAGGPGVTATDIARFPVPTLAPGICAVRVVATRNFTINAAPFFTSPPTKMVRGSVARYEEETC